MGKVIPDRELVASAYRRAMALKRAQKALDEAMRSAGPIGAPPDDFYDRLLSELDGERAWDEVLPTLVDNLTHEVTASVSETYRGCQE